MKRSVLFGSIVSFFVVILLVFSPESFAQEKEFKWPRFLRIATPGTASASFASTNAWAPLLQGDTGTMARVIPEDSEPGRYERLAIKKEFELASISTADARFSREGIDAYSTLKGAPTRVVWHHNDTPWLFVVRGDSKFKTIYDLKQEGVKVSVSSQAPTMALAVKKALPAFLGWTPEEAEKNWIFVPSGSYAENCRSVTDGRADVAWVAPISSVLAEMSGHPKGIRFLGQPLDDKEGWEGWLKYRPTHIPSKINMGVSAAIGVDGLTSNFIYWTYGDMGEDTVYNLAKWLNESFDKYKDSHALCKRMSIEYFREFLNHCGLPVHKGTVKYLREIGKWTEDDDKWNEEAIEKEGKWFQAREKALKEADEKGVKMHWENEEFLEIIKKHTKGLPIFKTRL